jgi:hypothetical protein
MNDWLNEGVLSWKFTTMEERSELKAQVARDLSEASGVTEQEASDFVRQWAHSSNDEDMRSLAIQQDAAKEFGLKTSDFTQSKVDPLKEKAAQSQFKQEQEAEYFKFKQSGATASELSAMEKQQDAVWAKRYPDVDVGYMPTPGYGEYPKLMPLMESDRQRAILRSMYNETQAELKSRGIKEVRLYRGVDLTRADADGLSKGVGVLIGTNALESWSVDAEVASAFAQVGPGRVGIVFEAVVPIERILSTPATGFGCLKEGEVIVLGGVDGDGGSVNAVY